jgi:hypothetical protein
MKKTLIILNIYRETTTQKILSVAVGIFNEKGQKEMEIVYPANLFPPDIKRGQEIYFSTLSPL